MTSLFELLIESSVRSLFLAILVGGVLLVLRVRASALRHRAWTFVLGGMLLMPVLPSVTPAVPALRVPLPAVLPAVDRDAFEVAEAAPPSVPAPGAFATAPTELVRRSSIRNAGAIVPAAPVDWRSVALLVHGIGAALLLVRLLLGWRATASLRRQRQAATRDFDQSALVTAPVTVGAFAPRVILPLNWREWPADKLTAVLAHEYAHVRRRDPLIALLASINHAIFWFHPVAWWLRRTLAVTAEHACDEAAVRAIGSGRRYAEVLIDMAEAVRRGGGRLQSHAVGVDGTGLFGERIERALCGVRVAETSRTRKVTVLATCLVAIVIAVACRRETVPPPLERAQRQDDPDRAKRKAQDAANAELYKAAISMEPNEALALHARWEKNPDDLAAAKQLLTYYQNQLWQYEVPRPQPFLDGRRAVGLWIIEHHPEHELAGRVWISPGPPAWPDPAGHARATQLWKAHLSRSDAAVPVLEHAASFFARTDPRFAEELYLRLKAKDPQKKWSNRLGGFYAGALGAPGAFPLPRSADDAHQEEIREKLDTSEDSALLSTAGFALSRHRDPEARRFGLSLLERALRMNPEDAQTRTSFMRLRIREQTQPASDRFRAKQLELVGGERVLAERAGGSQQRRWDMLREQEERALAALAEDDRLILLPNIAHSSYLGALTLRHDGADPKRLEAAITRARKYAEELVTLATRLPNHENRGTALFTANMTLSAIAMWPDGDKKRAVEYMRRAAQTPVDERLRFAYHLPMIQRPLKDLLTYGERESVIEFLERTAEISASERQHLLESAAAIRAGKAPAWY